MGEKVDGSYANLLQGVSQQPARDRVDGTCTEQINMASDPIRGLSCRNPIIYSGHIAKLSNYTFSETVVDGTLYSICTGANTIRVFQREPFLELTNVSEYDATAYVSKNMSVVAIKDDIFLANRDIITAMDSATPYTPINAGIVYCRGGSATYIFKVTLTHAGLDYTISFTPSTNKLATGSNIIKELATGLVNTIAANATLAAIYSVKYKDDVLEVVSNITSPVQLSVDDEVGGEDLVLINGSVDDPSKLPRYAPTGMTVTVSADGTSEDDDYYLCFTPDVGFTSSSPDGFGITGVWKECAKPGIVVNYNIPTMPIVLHIDKVAGTFEYDYGEWFPRSVGDENTNPVPSFIGYKINNLTVFQGRLGILSKSVCFSRTDAPLEFWKESATVLVDSDVVDVTSTIGTSSDFNTAVQHNKSLVINTSNEQYVVPGSVALTPTNAALVLSSSYTSSKLANPITTGTSMLLPFTYGDSAGIMEIFPSPDADNITGSVITNSINKYISGEIIKMSPSSNFNQVFVLSDSLYIYNYLWSGNEKVQSAFSKIDLSGFTVLDIVVYTDKLYVVYEDSEATYFGYMDLDTLYDATLGYCIYLDNRVTLPVIDNTITLPYTYKSDLYIVASGDASIYNGLQLDIDTVVGNVITLSDDITGHVYVGTGIDTLYIPTEPLVKDDNGVPLSSGRLRVQKLVISVKGTADVYYGMADKLYPDIWSEYLISSVYADVSGNIYDKLTLSTGIRVLPILRDLSQYYVRITRKGYTPINILDIEWEGVFTKRGKRI